MSWFTEIAGKAEDLLNKVDQTAATALQNAKTSPSRSNSYSIQNSDLTVGSGLFTPNKGLLSSPKNLSVSKSSKDSEKKPINSPKVISTRKKSESDDEKLMRFLNSEPLPTPSRKVKEKLDMNKEKNHTSSAENLSSVEPETTQAGDVEVKHSVDEETLTEINSNPNENSSESIINGENSNNISVLISSPSTISAIKDSPIKKINTPIEELLLAQKRADHAETEMKRMSKKLDYWNSQISGNDKSVRELREKEKDMLAAMDAKDSQLAILKVRLQEADQEICTKQSILVELKSENDRIIKEHAETAIIQNKTVETLQHQLQQVEIELSRTKESLTQFQTQHMRQISNMEEEHKHLVESYSSLQKKWSELNERNKDLSMQLKLANSNFDALQLDYNDYKQKAQRILQSKEKLISSLKEGNLDLESIEKNEASSLLLNAEVEAMKQERDLLKDEVRRASELAETYRSEIQELEKISQNDMVTSQEKCKNLKQLLDVEKVQKEELQLLNTQLKEELQLLREDLTRTKNSFQNRIQDREIEIEKLRRQLTAKSLSTVSQEELESRLHALTENLIQKQTIVEALSTEKNSLVLQLERLEQQLREAQNYGAQQHAFIGINTSETERKSKAVFLDNPFDSNLTRRVKKVYGTIDSFSIRLGVFFRRYPISRVFVIIYMLLLHFWVLFVLLTYEPEIHNSSYENPQTH